MLNFIGAIHVSIYTNCQKLASILPRHSSNNFGIVIIIIMIINLANNLYYGIVSNALAKSHI